MSQNCLNVLGITLISLLLVLLLALRIRRKRGARLDAPSEIKVAASPWKDTPYPGIDPSEYASTAEQQAALDRLATLPQFRRLANGTLTEWGSGASLTHCDCRLPPHPHLMVSWGPKRTQAIVSRQGLAHYVAYQERVANVLLMRLAVRITRDGGPAGVHSRRSTPSKKGR